MAGQWQKEFFLITEDPFAVDMSVFCLWLEGYSVPEAADKRRERFRRADVALVTPPAESAASPELFHRFGDLLAQDCAQQYEAFEFLEAALADPVHFLEFCPVHLAPSARRQLVSRYYSLDSAVVREVLRLQNAMRLQVSAGGKEPPEIEQIARASGAKVLKARRVLSNLQRACRWVEHAAQRHSHGHLGVATGPDGDQAASYSLAHGGPASSSARLHSSSVESSVLFVPEFEALGELLLMRYRSLTYVLLYRFDLWSKASQGMQCEQVEDIGAMLLAIGGVVTRGAAARPSTVAGRVEA